MKSKHFVVSLALAVAALACAVVSAVSGSAWWFAGAVVGGLCGGWEWVLAELSASTLMSEDLP